MNFANEQQLRAYFEAEMRKQREYDEQDEPTFAEWLREKFMKTRVVKTVQKVDKTWEKTKANIGKLLTNYSYIVGALATIAYASYILTREPATATTNANEIPLGLPELEEYAQEVEAQKEENLLSMDGVSKIKDKFRSMFN